jgi:hypothetical protein
MLYLDLSNADPCAREELNRSLADLAELLGVNSPPDGAPWEGDIDDKVCRELVTNLKGFAKALMKAGGRKALDALERWEPGEGHLERVAMVLNAGVDMAFRKRVEGRKPWVEPDEERDTANLSISRNRIYTVCCGEGPGACDPERWKDLRNGIEEIRAHLFGAKRPEKTPLSVVQQRILEVLGDRAMKGAVIAKQSGYSVGHIRDNLAPMVRAGLLEKVRDGYRRKHA